MAKDLYEEAFEKLEEIECNYLPTLEKYKEKGGDINVFTDFSNSVEDLWNVLMGLPENDDYYEILQKVLYYRSAVDDLMH